MAQRVQIILPRRADVLHTECGTDLGTVKEKKKNKNAQAEPIPCIHAHCSYVWRSGICLHR